MMQKTRTGFDRRRFLAACCAFAGVLMGGGLTGNVPPAAASGAVILTVEADSAGGGEGAKTTFTAGQLEALGLRRIETETPWSNGPVVFEGPLLRDVLAKSGLKGNMLKATALNDYQVMIPRSDADTHDVILAVRANGKPIGVRERGPVRVIYPWSESEDLRAELYYARAIWQLRSISVLAQP